MLEIENQGARSKEAKKLSFEAKCLHTTLDLTFGTMQCVVEVTRCYRGSGQNRQSETCRISDAEFTSMTRIDSITSSG